MANRMGHTVHSADIANFSSVTHAHHEQTEGLGGSGSVHLGVTCVVSAAAHGRNTPRPHGGGELLP